jgi:hypothetical protein
MTIATRTRTRALAVAVATAIIGAATPAHAQSAEAESLFREGKRLMKKGQLAQACDKFDAADHVEATASTELNLADCREKTGQLATAWAMFIKAATTAKRAGDAKRDAEGRRRAAALEPQLVYLTILVPEEARIDGLVIKRNDAAIDPALWDQRVPVDPDEYTISAEAPGHKPWSTAVVVKTKSKKVEVPVLEARPDRKPRREAKAATGSSDGDERIDRGRLEGRESGDRAADEPRDRSADEPHRPMTGKRKWSIALAAAGVAAVGTGIGLGIYANRLEDKADALCRGVLCGDPDAIAFNQRARNYALGANVGYAAGGAALVGAIVLWFVDAPESPHSGTTAVIPTLGAGKIGAAFARSF